VATFYSFLRPETEGRLVFRLCRTYSCHLTGSDKVAEQLQADLGIGFGETSADGAISLEWTNCMGMCDQGPALLVNDEVYTQLTPDSVHGIVEDYRKRQSGRAVEPVSERVT
jgi:[NiFe] hydrogenase diaphorase moiety large subunit